MEQLFQIVALCIVSAILMLVLRKGTPELSLCLSILTVVLVCTFLASGIQELLNFLQQLTRLSGVSEGLFLPLYKIIGIALIARVGERICDDAGDSALAAVVETAGSICAFLCAMPLLETVLDMLMELLS